MTSDASSPRPSVKDFYDGLYHSPLFARHHKICCNVGFHGGSAGAADDAAKFHAAYANDAYQLQLYRELISIVPSQDLRSLTAAAAATQQPLRILDVGCGAGGGLCELQTLFPTADLLGADISSQAITRATETWARFTAKVPDVSRKRELKLLNQSCEHLKGVASHSIDVVCAVQTLQEVQHLKIALAEIQRVLKAGGYLFIADFIPQDPATDRLHNEFLASIADSNGTLGFEIVQETLASYNAAMGCQLSSSLMKALINEHIPQEFRSDMETFFLVEDSNLYELLRRDQMGYRLVCLRKLAGAPASEDSIDGGEWREIEAGYSSEEADDSDEEEIYDDDLPNYYEYKELYPQLEVLKDNYAVILEEMQAVLQSSTWPFWPEKHYAEGDNEWRVFPFCYTFPAYDASKTMWVPPTCEMCPRTVEVLKSIPGIRTALFSKLGPGTTLTAHRGWADLSNHILRCHLGLVVPTLDHGKPCCSMVVGGERCAHQERGIIVFDDSKLHFAYNHHDEDTRIVLIIDLYRPDHLPRGRAKGGHSDELDEFIDTFGKQGLNDEEDEEA
uniref:Aspartyl/asparaginy/proline hydroxylase domain-containing protein n=1 Tax=Globisporangium ultimum (strain ATCC 200006 / CBS 805.95 / DAOM BR144) TaxID=431595 RepID=K3WA84_GLOUD